MNFASLVPEASLLHQVYESGDGCLKGIRKALKRARVTWYDPVLVFLQYRHLQVVAKLLIHDRTPGKSASTSCSTSCDMLQVCMLSGEGCHYGVPPGQLPPLLPLPLCPAGGLHLLSPTLPYCLQSPRSSLHSRCCS